MMYVCLFWWSGSISGNATRFNRECFEKAGHKVYLSEGNIPNFSDVVFSPMPNLNFENIDKPVIIQFGGYGRQLVLPDQGFSDDAKECLEKAELVTILDPNMFLELDRNGIDEKTVTIPNATPPIAIPPENHSKFRVLCPTTDPLGGVKSLDRFVEAARIVGEEEDIEFVIPVKSRGIYRNSIDWLGVDNLRIIPRQPHDRMLEWYGRSDVIAPFSACEIFPQTALEAFLSGKPAIFDELGMIQSIHREYLEEIESDFGASSSEFHKKWRNEYGSGEGDHYLKAESSEELAELVLELYTDEKRRAELGNNALEWISEFWEPGNRGERIIDCWREFS